MCEFCLKHGEGKKWYLQAANYSEDLLSDMRRRNFIQQSFGDLDALSRDVARLDDLDKAPGFVRRVIRWKTARSMKKLHWGQVLPIEDVETIFGFVNSIVRVACVCRHLTIGGESRFCYGISMGPGGGKLSEIFRGLDHSFFHGPEGNGLEFVTKDEALAAFRVHEKAGLCHTVWTFRTPFIGGICNCDRSDCLAMRTTVTHDLPVMFRAEYVAQTTPDLCEGCRRCMKVCQFGAIGFSAATRKTAIDPRRCYGCGICRAVCKSNAITLTDRRQSPLAARLW